jgi:dihydrofolate reductase
MNMARVRVENFTLSLDGYGAGPDQSLENPLGRGGEALHDWLVNAGSWRRLHGKAGGATGIDDEFAERGIRDVGAWILGRNMFGPIRGPWPDEDWNG